MKNFFSQLLQNFGRSFGIKKIPWHFLAIFFTYGLSVSGFDWWYFTHTRSILLQSILFPAAAVGGLVPFTVPLAVYAWGAMNKSARAVQAGFLLVQAVILGFLISGSYKALTGRIQPPLRGVLLDNSLGFRFGFWRGGVFWGWPSTHTTVAFAMAITLFILFPKNKLIRFFLVAYVLYIGIGVSTNIHWFSDFVAGAIIGTVIGVVVGKSFVEQKIYKNI